MKSAPDDIVPGLFVSQETSVIPLALGAVLLRSFALAEASSLLAAVQHIMLQAPLRQMMTPGGFKMSVAMTNCGDAGWVSDRAGYRYDTHDPISGQPWPNMPEIFCDVARRAAASAGHPDFAPDACLINRYTPGARLTLLQDKNENDFDAPIVSVSLGSPATFLFGGLRRSEKPKRVMLHHGDVAVWGGVSRLAYHGIAPLKESHHPETGAMRINLTFRRARRRT